MDLNEQMQHLIVNALTNALASPAGLPLYRKKSIPGLFPNQKAAQQAADHTTKAGYLTPTESSNGQRIEHDLYQITESGIRYLLDHCHPQPILEKLHRSLDEQTQQLAEINKKTNNVHRYIEQIKDRIEIVLNQIEHATLHDLLPKSSIARNGASTAKQASWKHDLLTYLTEWQQRAGGDCPMPELYQWIRKREPALTIGQFHDGLRSLHQEGRITFQPWSGSLHEVPEPACAMLFGHAVAYYVNRKEESH